MRIAKVALAFFSVGFLAGSFERAAGLGYVDRGKLERHQMARADAAIVRSAAAAFGWHPAGQGLPEELLARPLGSPPDVPHEVVAALSDLVDEHAVRPTPIAYAPLAPEGPPPLVPESPRSLDLADPDLRGPLLGGQRSRSEPPRQPLSPAPPPMSLLEAGPLPEDPSAPPDARSRDPRPQVAIGPDFIMPFERGRVTSLFHDRRYHPAIDLAGPLGTPVHATTARQRVIFTGWRNGYGNTVVTRDDKGRMHLYAHLHRVRTKPGTVLDQGKLLGLLGSTGRSTGPHVHYEVKTRAGAHVDPAKLLFPGRRVHRGLAWNGSRSITRVASRADRNQPRPR